MNDEKTKFRCRLMLAKPALNEVAEATYRIDRRGVSDNGVAVKAHIGKADVKLRSSGRNQHATPRFARKMNL